MCDENIKRIINIKPEIIQSKEQEYYQKLEAEIISQIEQLPPLKVEDWGKINFLLQSEGSLFHQAQAAKFKAVLNILEPARNTSAWTAKDDQLAYDMYVKSYREALDYLLRAECLLGHVEEAEYALIEKFDIDKVQKLEIYLSWLKRRFAINQLLGCLVANAFQSNKTITIQKVTKSLLAQDVLQIVFNLTIIVGFV